MTIGFTNRHVFFCLAMFPLLLACRQNAVVKEKPELPYYTEAGFTPRWIGEGDKGLDTLHHIAAFSFTNQDGRPVTQETTNGKIYVADFFFCNCPGICPRLTKNMAILQEAIKNDTMVLLLSHSVTPERDSVAVLRAYAAAHQVLSGKWHLLTGNRDSIYAIARQSYFADEDLGMQKTTDDFLHTENMLLIDQHQHIRGIYKGTSESEMQNLLEDIRSLEAND